MESRVRDTNPEKVTVASYTLSGNANKALQVVTQSLAYYRCAWQTDDISPLVIPPFPLENYNVNLDRLCDAYEKRPLNGWNEIPPALLGNKYKGASGDKPDGVIPSKRRIDTTRSVGWNGGSCQQQTGPGSYQQKPIGLVYPVIWIDEAFL